MPSILFVCTGNMYRSPIAAETFRNAVQRDGKQNLWQISSAGTWTTDGLPAPAEAINVAKALGLNLDNHQTRTINKTMLEESDLVLVMEDGHKEALQVEFPFAHEKIHLISQALQGLIYDIPDPAAARNETSKILQELSAMVNAGYRNIYKIVEEK